MHAGRCKDQHRPFSLRRLRLRFGTCGKWTSLGAAPKLARLAQAQHPLHQRDPSPTRACGCKEPRATRSRGSRQRRGERVILVARTAVTQRHDLCATAASCKCRQPNRDFRGTSPLARRHSSHTARSRLPSNMVLRRQLLLHITRRYKGRSQFYWPATARRLRGL